MWPDLSKHSLVTARKYLQKPSQHEPAHKMQNAKHKMQIVIVVINHFSCNWQGHLDTGDTYGKNYYYEALKKWSEEAFSQANTTP